MKIFANSKFIKKIAIFLIIITLCSFVMPKSTVNAESFVADDDGDPGGKMLNPIMNLLMYIGDAILTILQNNFLSEAPILVEGQSDQYKDFNGWALVGVVLAALGFVVGICLAVPTAGTSLLVSVKCFAIGAAICTVSAFAFQYAGSEFLDDWDGNFDIPMLQYTPYAIFSGQIPALDINFIDPMETTYSTRNIEETEIKGDYDSRFEWDSFGDYLESSFSFEGDEDFKKLVQSINATGFDWTTVASGEAHSTYPDAVLELTKIEDELNWVQIVANSKADWYEKYPRIDVAGIGDQSTSVYVLYDRNIYHFVGKDAEGYTNKWELSKLNLDDFIENMETIEKEDGTQVIPEQNVIEKEYKSSAKILQSGISTWYKVLRTVALVGLLSVLVYIGIRILFASAAADKAKYKKMIIDWVVAVCILFILHYLMVFILTISTSLTKIVIPKATNNLVVPLPNDTKIGANKQELVEYAKEQVSKIEESGFKIEDNMITDENGNPTWIGEYTGYIRLIAGIKKGWNSVAYGLMYLVLVIYTCMFTFMYLKRTLYMAFLTMIAPLIALTYPLDKIKDGKAQAFSLWLREFIFNALIQPVHLILYTMLMSMVLNLAVEHPVYAIVALGFFTPAERFIRKMFGFESAGTVSALGQMAGGAAVMGAVNKLSKLNKRKKKDEEDDDGKVRTKEEGGHGLPFGIGGQGGNGEGGNSPIPNPLQNNGNPQEQNGANENNNPLAMFDSRLTQDQRDELTEEGIQPGDAEYEQYLANHGINGRDPREDREQRNEQKNTQQSQEENSEDSSKPRTRNRFLAGMKKVGNHYKKKALKAKPLRTVGKWTGRIIGGATLGTVGLAAGIASGDVSKAFSYTAAGAGVGGALGGTVAENAMDEGHEIKENFSKGFQGEAEYTNKKLDEEYYNGTGKKGENFQDLLEQEDLKGDLKGRERAKALKKDVQEYRKSGITDNTQIATCMRAGLTPEEGVYAVQISKAMEKSGWNSPKTKKDYEESCKRLLRDNNVSEERINEIWNTVPKLLF